MSNMLPAKAGNAASPRKCGEGSVLLSSQVVANVYFNQVPPVDASIRRLMLSASTEQPATGQNVTPSISSSPACPKRKSYRASDAKKTTMKLSPQNHLIIRWVKSQALGPAQPALYYSDMAAARGQRLPPLHPGETNSTL